MKTELIQDYFCTLKKPCLVYRFVGNNNRFYYTLDENGFPTFHISLTTLIRATVPKAEHLVKWIADMGYDESRSYMKERADYGNYMHILFAELIKSGSYIFEETENICRELSKRNGWMFKDEWVDDLNDDVAGFMQFLIDHEVKAIALEMVLVSKTGYGTAIDLVCEMKIEEKGFYGEVYKSGERKGEPKETKMEKRITALINYKSGRKGFYEENEIQLEFEKRLFEENYPAIKIDKVFNYAPSQWRTDPSYKLSDQTGSVNKEKADHLLAIAQIELMKKLPTIKTINGNVKIGEMPEIKYTSARDYIMEMNQKSKTETTLPVPIAEIPLSTETMELKPKRKYTKKAKDETKDIPLPSAEQIG